MSKARRLAIAIKPFSGGPRSARRGVRLFDLDSGEDIAGIKSVKLEYDVAGVVTAEIKLIIEHLEMDTPADRYMTAQEEAAYFESLVDRTNR